MSKSFFWFFCESTKSNIKSLGIQCSYLHQNTNSWLSYRVVWITNNHLKRGFMGAPVFSLFVSLNLFECLQSLLYGCTSPLEVHTFAFSYFGKHTGWIKHINHRQNDINLVYLSTTNKKYAKTTSCFKF